MIANEESEKRCKVVVTRVKPRQLVVAERNHFAWLPILPVSLGLGGSSALSSRPTAEISSSNDTQTAEVPRIRIRLEEGSVKVNGRKVSIPIGLAGRMTGKNFKELANIYKGDVLYIRQPGGLQRIRDAETVEVVPDAKFTHSRPAPKMRSTPWYGTD